MLPRPVLALSHICVAQVSCGHSHCCAVTDSGDVWAWGSSRTFGHTEQSAYPNVPTMIKATGSWAAMGWQVKILVILFWENDIYLTDVPLNLIETAFWNPVKSQDLSSYSPLVPTQEQGGHRPTFQQAIGTRFFSSPGATRCWLVRPSSTWPVG